MTVPPTNPEMQRMGELAALKEHQFRSSMPVVGPLIAKFRRLWNSVSTKWYIDPVIAQQSDFNSLVVSQLARAESQLARAESQLVQQAADHEAAIAWLTDQDHGQVDLIHRQAEIAMRVVQIERRVSELEQRLARLEAVGDTNGDHGV